MHLSFLRGWQPQYADAAVACVAGCACEGTAFSTWSEWHWTLFVIHLFEVGGWLWAGTVASVPLALPAGGLQQKLLASAGECAVPSARHAPLPRRRPRGTRAAACE